MLSSYKEIINMGTSQVLSPGCEAGPIPLAPVGGVTTTVITDEVLLSSFFSHEHVTSSAFYVIQ